MTETWISTTELCQRLSMSRTQLERLRKQKPPVLSAGHHFISKGVGPRSGFLWDYVSVVDTLGQLALQNEVEPAVTSHG